MQTGKNFLAQFRIVQDIGRPNVSPTEDIEEDIAEADQIEGEGPFGKIKIVIEINPAKVSILVIDENVVSSYIPMLETMAVEQDNSLHRSKEAAQEIFHMTCHIYVMITVDPADCRVQPGTPDDIQYPDQIAGIVKNRVPLHKH